METIKQVIEQLKSTQMISPFFINKDDFKKVIFEVCPEFEVDVTNKQLLNEIYLYLNGGSKELDNSKGIWFYGVIGTGKSTLMKIIAEVDRLMKPDFEGGFKCVNCSNIANIFSSKGIVELDVYTYNETERGIKPVPFGFDELGREPMPAKYFGTETNVMQYILSIRYELRSYCKTFVTTNIKKELIGQVYGEYIADRLNEMFNFVEVKGISRRTQAKPQNKNYEY